VYKNLLILCFALRCGKKGHIGTVKNHTQNCLLVQSGLVDMLCTALCGGCKDRFSQQILLNKPILIRFLHRLWAACQWGEMVNGGYQKVVGQCRGQLRADNS